MPTTPISPEKQAEIDDLEEAIRQAVEAEIGELAAYLFGDNGFKNRVIALKIAAKAYEQHWWSRRNYPGNLSRPCPARSSHLGRPGPGRPRPDAATIPT